MNRVPNPGEKISLETGDATVFEVRQRYGDVTILAGRDHPVHPFATWKWDPHNGALYAGRYFERLADAEVDYDQR